MTIYSCKTCNVASFATKQAYDRHIKSQKHIKGSNDTVNKFICICGKWFFYSSGLSAHKKNCKKQKNDECENTNSSTSSLQDEFEKMKEDFQKEREKMYKEKEELKSQISLLLENQNNKPMKTRRRKITPFLRSKIKESQNHACNICSLPLSEYFQIDHMIALQYGGTDDEQNLQALCCECHAKKSIIENKKRESIKKAIDFIINQEISESPDPRIQNSM